MARVDWTISNLPERSNRIDSIGGLALLCSLCARGDYDNPDDPSREVSNQTKDINRHNQNKEQKESDDPTAAQSTQTELAAGHGIFRMRSQKQRAGR